MFLFYVFLGFDLEGSRSKHVPNTHHTCTTHVRGKGLFSKECGGCLVEVSKKMCTSNAECKYLYRFQKEVYFLRVLKSVESSKL